MKAINYIQFKSPLHTDIQNKVPNVQQKTNLSFNALLTEQTTNQLKVSKHAFNRLQERNIHINDQQWEHITNKVFEAKSKGVNDSLVLTDNVALIVSAKNATVITAMDRNEIRNQLFTNIDGTIVMG